MARTRRSTYIQRHGFDPNLPLVLVVGRLPKGTKIYGPMRGEVVSELRAMGKQFTKPFSIEMVHDSYDLLPSSGEEGNNNDNQEEDANDNNDNE